MGYMGMRVFSTPLTVMTTGVQAGYTPLENVARGGVLVLGPTSTWFGPVYRGAGFWGWCNRPRQFGAFCGALI